MNSYKTPNACPNCGGELIDLWDGEPVSAFIGEWSEDRFKCIGYKKIRHGNLSDTHPFNRSHSCGYYGLENFGIEYKE